MAGSSHRGRSSSPSPSGNSFTYSDRFIPSRSATNQALYTLPTPPAGSGSLRSRRLSGDGDGQIPGEGGAEEVNGGGSSSVVGGGNSGGPYAHLLRSELLSPAASPSSSEGGAISGSSIGHLQPGGANRSPNILKFRSEALSPTSSPFSVSPFTEEAGSGLPKRAPRRVPRSPFKVLDAPALQDDFYLNLVDWSSQNVLAVGLSTCVYLWSAHTSIVTKLCDLGPRDSVCSVAWTGRGNNLAVGTREGEVQVWDATKGSKVNSYSGHDNRVGALSWAGRVLASGSRDLKICLRDVRASDSVIASLQGHSSEVCGLKWSSDDRELASGGNDNQLLVWSAASLPQGQPLFRFNEHKAAVKAIAWSPHQHGLLASGGGTADRTIRFWNTTTGAHLQHIDTGSQVCNLAWSKNVNELVSTHGFSQNQIMLWRYPTLQKLATLTGHSFRVLYLAISPDGQTIVTGAGDETLRFWNVFPGPKSPSNASQNSIHSPSHLTIR